MLTKRNVWFIVLLTVITGGLYMAYWFVKTKFELNEMGAGIPTAFLFFIPLVNFYFIYQFAKAFTEKFLGDSSQTTAYFFLFSLLMPVGVILAQTKINGK